MMNPGPSVIVNKRGGFFTALVYGVFGTIMAAMACGTGVAIYAIHVADGHAGRLISLGGGLLEALPEWRKNLPPALADALNDRRDPDYRQQVDVSVRLEEGSRKSSSRGLNWRGHTAYQAVVEVKNNGKETISLLSLRIMLENAQAVPVWESSAYVATPLAVDAGWRGPLLPGSVRKIPLTVWLEDASSQELKPSFEVTDLRVWTGQPVQPLDGTAKEPDKKISAALP